MAGEADALQARVDDYNRRVREHNRDIDRERDRELRTCTGDFANSSQ